MIRSLSFFSVSAILIALAPAAPVPKASAAYYFPTTVGDTAKLSRDNGEELVLVVKAVKQKGDTTVVMIEGGDGTSGKVSVSAKGLCHLGSDDSPFDPPLWSLRLDLKPGEQWKQEESEELTAGQPEPLTVPAGTFTAIRVETNSKTHDGTVIKSAHWYARGVGLVRYDVFVDGKWIVESVLTKFTHGSGR